MVTVTPSGKSPGARITDIDLAEPIDEHTFAVPGIPRRGRDPRAEAGARTAPAGDDRRRR
jgi:hypothetical protein